MPTTTTQAPGEKPSGGQVAATDAEGEKAGAETGKKITIGLDENLGLKENS
ncbi:hypothetical protein [Nitrososphaera sp.]|uniref:hypothetical protein n=1 Tax=Nitrososphaera sp. TaxID=1971748 RepID=UPI00307F7C96